MAAQEDTRLFEPVDVIKGQLAMDTDPPRTDWTRTCGQCGAQVHPMADLGEMCCDWEARDAGVDRCSDGR